MTKGLRVPLCVGGGERVCECECMCAPPTRFVEDSASQQKRIRDRRGKEGVSARRRGSWVVSCGPNRHLHRGLLVLYIDGYVDFPTSCLCLLEVVYVRVIVAVSLCLDPKSSSSSLYILLIPYRVGRSSLSSYPGHVWTRNRAG